MKGKLKKCPCCDEIPSAYSRYENDKVLYSWYQCDGTPPCYVGTCHKPEEKNIEQKMINGWNKATKDKGATAKDYEIDKLESRNKELEAETKQLKKENQNIREHWDLTLEENKELKRIVEAFEAAQHNWEKINKQLEQSLEKALGKQDIVLNILTGLDKYLEFNSLTNSMSRRPIGHMEIKQLINIIKGADDGIYKI